ncbi:ferrous iron transport protein B [Halobacteriovorax marinus]|uniref:ferrous iron transport protein B n=1 Tax=Halobacteriovorax marinus TaxID=97084 RepID=UPI003A9151BA
MKEARVLFVGFPNSGKSSLFNLLSGQKRKVTNYSGITVDAAEGMLLSNSSYEEKVSIVDLPGMYNLVPTSIDEGVSLHALLNLSADKPYDLVALIIDLERFESSMSLCLALKELVGEKMVLIINKDDKGEITREQLKVLEELTGCRALSTCSKKERSREIDRFLRDNLQREGKVELGEIILSKESLSYIPDFKEIKSIKIEEDQREVITKLDNYHKRAREIVDKVVKPDTRKIKVTKKLDQILIHPLWGSLIFVAVFYLIFNSIYEWAGPLMDMIDNLVAIFGDWVASTLPEGYLKSLIVDGIIAGVGGVIIFAPQIGILFFLLSLLEQSGYISRAAVLSDRVMSIFGLNGKAFLPYLSGFACSIPGIMAARTIPSKKERIATIMTLPMITCSARLPVYILLIGTFVPEKKIFGFLNSQSLSFFFLYFLGSFFALAMALVFRLSYFKGETSSFFIDLPYYQRPRLRIAFGSALQKVKFFCKKAGSIILVLSIGIWFASTFPRLDANSIAGLSDDAVASMQLEHSLIGKIGKTLEPALEPIGMDWKMGVGLLVAFGARELFVSTMGTIYALGEVDEESSTLRQRLKMEKDSVTGDPKFNLAVAWSILIFFVFSLQCTSTLAILRRELGNWKQPTFMFLYMGALAWLGSFITYNILS